MKKGLGHFSPVIMGRGGRRSKERGPNHTLSHLEKSSLGYGFHPAYSIEQKMMQLKTLESDI